MSQSQTRPYGHNYTHLSSNTGTKKLRVYFHFPIPRHLINSNTITKAPLAARTKPHLLKRLNLVHSREKSICTSVTNIKPGSHYKHAQKWLGSFMTDAARAYACRLFLCLSQECETGLNKGKDKRIPGVRRNETRSHQRSWVFSVRGGPFDL